MQDKQSPSRLEAIRGEYWWLRCAELGPTVPAASSGCGLGPDATLGTKHLNISAKPWCAALLPDDEKSHARVAPAQAAERGLCVALPPNTSLVSAAQSQPQPL